MSDINYLHKIQKGLWIKKIFFLIGLFFLIFPLILFSSYFFISGATDNFPTDKVFYIKKGMTVKEIAVFLEKENIIKSAFIFEAYDKYLKIIKKKNTKIKSERYNFSQPLDVFGVYKRLSEGVSGIKPIKIRVVEGEPNFKIAENISEKFYNITKKKFEEKAKKYEGYLYPDTYLFSPYSSSDFIIQKMRKTFEEQNKDILEKIRNSDRSLDKIIIMASLIEKEAGSENLEIKKIVSGILWNRIKKGMKLQVDAVFSYINKKHIKNTRFSHLKVESPYNTYKYKGFPPTAIGNPTNESILAAFSPINTDYLYYITGRDGKFYYSKTAKGHRVNILKYRINYKKK